MMKNCRSSKYNARKATVDGITFDSRKEAARYAELKLMERAGLIRDLERQVKFVLIPAQYEPDRIDYSKSPKGRKVKGRLIERECAYIADFRYFSIEDGKTIVEDSKGLKTKDYVIKRKLMLHVYGIRIKET